jgi:hypothetical protein
MFTFLLFTKWLAIFGMNIYWVYFTQLAPLLFSWMFAERAFAERRIGFYLGLSVLILIRAMCGYEYCTNVALGALIPIVYVALTNPACRPKLNGTIALSLLAVGIGLAVAFTIHLVQLFHYFQDWSGGVNYLKSRFLARTYGGMDSSAMPDATTQLEILWKYLKYDVLLVPHYFEVSLKQVIILSVATGTACAIYGVKCLATGGKVPEIVVWPVLCLLGLFASWSWQLIFKGHMYHHDFLNMMVYLFPFLITCYMACAVSVAGLVRFLTNRIIRVSE